LEGDNNDGAENRVYNRMPIRELHNHRALQRIFNLTVPHMVFSEEADLRELPP